MSRRFTTQAEVLYAVRERLRFAVPRYNDQNCFVSDQPIPPTFPGGRECVTISPGAGQFGDALFAGAGIRTLTEDSQILITPLIRHKRDRPEQADQAMLGEYDGLMIRKGEILSALLLDDYDLEIAGRYLLRNSIAPANCQAPGEVTVGQYQLVGMTLTFSCPFDWGLSAIPLEGQR